MKNIKDYLHLYLGCEFIVNDVHITKPLDYWNLLHSEQNNEPIKPILRRLEDMTQVEAQTIFGKYFEKDFADDFSNDSGSLYFNPKKIKPTKEHALRIIEGLDYETGDFMKVISIVPYLLSKHFDLFNLINSGLAIDSKTLHPV